MRADRPYRDRDHMPPETSFTNKADIDPPEPLLYQPPQSWPPTPYLQANPFLNNPEVYAGREDPAMRNYSLGEMNMRKDISSSVPGVMLNNRYSQMTPAYHQQPMVQQSAEFFGQPKTDSGLNPEEAAQKRWLRRKKKSEKADLAAANALVEAGESALEPVRQFPSGGRYCRFPSCKRKAQGRTDFCISHGGGRRCSAEDCERGAAGASDFCKKHGGGTRCSYPGCDHSSQGPSSFCIKHGGGYRCRYPACPKSARAARSFCYRHGGGRKGGDNNGEGSVRNDSDQLSSGGSVASGSVSTGLASFPKSATATASTTVMMNERPPPISGSARTDLLEASLRYAMEPGHQMPNPACISLPAMQRPDMRPMPRAVNGMGSFDNPGGEMAYGNWGNVKRADPPGEKPYYMVDKENPAVGLCILGMMGQQPPNMHHPGPHPQMPYASTGYLNGMSAMMPPPSMEQHAFMNGYNKPYPTNVDLSRMPMRQKGPEASQPL